MNSNFINQLQNFKLTLNTEDLKKIEELVQLVEIYNQEFNLVSKKSLSNIYNDHIADSLSIALIDLNEYNIDNTFSLVDIGSGAGFPGIPISILFKNSKITMEQAEDIVENIGDKLLKKLLSDQVKQVKAYVQAGNAYEKD